MRGIVSELQTSARRAQHLNRWRICSTHHMGTTGPTRPLPFRIPLTPTPSEDDMTATADHEETGQTLTPERRSATSAVPFHECFPAESCRRWKSWSGWTSRSSCGLAACRSWWTRCGELGKAWPGGLPLVPRPGSELAMKGGVPCAAKPFHGRRQAAGIRASARIPLEGPEPALGKAPAVAAGYLEQVNRTVGAACPESGRTET